METKSTEKGSVEERQNQLNKLFSKWEERSIADHFERQAKHYAASPLLMMPEGTWTYEELWNRAETIAKALIHMGVRKNDHVAVLMANDPDFIGLWLAISRIGGVMVPLNTQLKEEELGYMLRQSDTRWLILHQEAGKQKHAENLYPVLQTLKKEGIFQQAVAISNSEKQLPETYQNWDEFIAGAKEVSEETLRGYARAASNPHKTAAIIYTSGSTGLPKGVMLTDDMLLRSGYATCYTRGYEAGRRIFAPLPLYHVYFVEEGLFAVSFVGGAMITSTGFSALESLQLMEKYQANDFLAVPSMLVSILNQKTLKDHDLTALDALLCCAAPSPVPLWQRAVNELGVTEIGTGCGATEASSTTMLTAIGDPLEVVSTRVGKVKDAGVAGIKNGRSVRYKVIDPDTGKDLPDGAVGELAVKGNVVSKGYYKKPEETAFALSKDGWMRSGDLGRIDKNGYIQLLGRSKNVYKVSGETVAPKEIEDMISTHPAVTQVYIVGVSDRFTTETGAAFVELKEGKSCTEQEIRNWCKEKVARFKVPRYVLFVKSEDWPLTGTGKIQKFKLQERAKQLLNL